MRGQLLDVVQTQATAREDLFDREQRQVGIVFVINRVELDLFDQLQQMRELDRHGAFRLQ